MDEQLFFDSVGTCSQQDNETQYCIVLFNIEIVLLKSVIQQNNKVNTVYIDTLCLFVVTTSQINYFEKDCANNNNNSKKATNKHSLLSCVMLGVQKTMCLMSPSVVKTTNKFVLCLESLQPIWRFFRYKLRRLNTC